MSDALEAPDLEHCQTWMTKGSAFRFGDPRRTEQCGEPPTYLLEENAPGDDGLLGSMAVCANCYLEFQKNAPDNVTVSVIENKG